MAKHQFPKAMPPGIPKLHKHIFDMPSEVYHKIEGTYSSSQFKDLLDDEEIFIKKYIEKTIPKEDIPAFGTGNYFHTGVLEPHKLKQDCIVYTGKMRRGAEWEKFKAKHGEKTIITQGQLDQANLLIKSVQDSPIAMGYVERGRPEVSLFTELWIYNGEIFAPKFNVVLDFETGWIEYNCKDLNPKKCVIIIVKVRADSLGDDFVLDLKSTTGNARSERAMRGKISYYNYDLSASLYLDMFSLLGEEMLTTFIWVFASKDCHNCKSFKASPTNILVGRAKWMRGVLKLAECMRNEFQLYDELGILEPEHYELDILKVTDASLL